MIEEQKEQEPEEDQGEKMAYPNLSEKELQRDLINLHLPEIDLIEDGDFEARREALIAKYGQEWYDEMIGDVEDEDEDEDEKNKTE